MTNSIICQMRYGFLLKFYFLFFCLWLSIVVRAQIEQYKIDSLKTTLSHVNADLV